MSWNTMKVANFLVDHQLTRMQLRVLAVPQLDGYRASLMAGELELLAGLGATSSDALRELLSACAGVYRMSRC